MNARIAILFCAALSSACFAVTDLDRFGKAEAVTANFSDLHFTVRGMKSHVNEYFEYRVVDAANVIQSRGLVVPLGGEAASLFVRGAVPRQNGPFRLDFFADHDGTPGYGNGVLNDHGVEDHAWRIPLDDSMRDDKGAYTVVFDHNTSFSRLDTPAPPREVGKPVTIRLRNMGPFAGRRVETRVADASSARVVALYRVPVLTHPEMDLTVPGMAEESVSYTIELYTDDGAATPGSIRAFRLERDSGPDGLDVVFDPAAPDVQPAGDVTPP